MKTITCDRCSRTVPDNSRKAWSKIQRSESALNQFTYTPMYFLEQEIDICERCTAVMMDWLHLEIETRPDDE